MSKPHSYFTCLLGLPSQTTTYLRTEGYRNLFCNSSGGRKSDIKESAGWCALWNQSRRILPCLFPTSGVVGNPRCCSASRHITPISPSTTMWHSPCVCVDIFLFDEDISHQISAQPYRVWPHVNLIWLHVQTAWKKMSFSQVLGTRAWTFLLGKCNWSHNS